MKRLNRRERIMAVLKGKPVDRPPFNFYEINGFDENPDDSNPFNIFSHPSWWPLLRLAREKTDRMVRRGISLMARCDPWAGLKKTEEREEDGRRVTKVEIRVGRRTLSSLHVRYMDQDTTWCVEPLIKDLDDLKVWLELPMADFDGNVDVTPVTEVEEKLGDTGIVLIDVADPLCEVASLFTMEDFLVVAFSERKLFRKALEKVARFIIERTVAVAKAVPGRLWRIVGAEYASPPYLPPAFFREYVVSYERPMVEAIQRYGGFARIHCHGRIRDILDDIVSTGCMGIDPVEPPPQGDVTLAYVREKYGRKLVLFGNIEVSEIETLPSLAFETRVRSALREGPAEDGSGFVLMPTGAPVGRVLGARTLHNYTTIVKVVEEKEEHE